jgi:hypothetical protein
MVVQATHHQPRQAKEITAGVTHHQAPITPLVVEVVHLLLVATIQETHLALVALVLPHQLQVHL